MIGEDALLRPSLRQYPDARRGPLPLVEPLLLPYLALMFGSAVAGLIAFYNAIVIRRIGSAFAALLVGAAGWIASVVIAGAADDAGMANFALVLLALRVMHLVIGCVLFYLQRPYVQGHAFLGGSMAPALASYVVAFAIAWFLPVRVLLFLLGVPLGQ